MLNYVHHCTHVCVCARARACVCVRARACVYVLIRTIAHGYVGGWVCVCEYGMCASIDIPYSRTHVCVHVYACVCECLCVCMHACCVCVRAGARALVPVQVVWLSTHGITCEFLSVCVVTITALRIPSTVDYMIVQ